MPPPRLHSRLAPDFRLLRSAWPQAAARSPITHDAQNIHSVKALKYRAETRLPTRSGGYPRVSPKQE